MTYRSYKTYNSLDPRPKTLTTTQTMTITETQPRHAMAWTGHSTMENITQTFRSRVPEVYAYIEKNGGQVAGPMYARYLHFTQTDMELEIGVFVKEPIEGNGDIKPVEIPGGQATSQDYFGPYSGLPGAWNAAHKWFEAQSEWEISGPPMEVYLNDPTTEPDPAKLHTQIIHPVRKKG